MIIKLLLKKFLSIFLSNNDIVVKKTKYNKWFNEVPIVFLVNKSCLLKSPYNKNPITLPGKKGTKSKERTD